MSPEEKALRDIREIKILLKDIKTFFQDLDFKTLIGEFKAAVEASLGLLHGELHFANEQHRGPTKKIFKVSEVARITRLKKGTIRGLITSGELHGTKQGSTPQSQYTITRQALLQFCRERGIEVQI